MLIDKLESYHGYFTRRISGWIIAACVCIFISVGLVVLSSASLSFIGRENFFEKQIRWYIIGCLFFLIGSVIDLGFLKRNSTTIFITICVALVLVLIPGIGKMVNGSRRWIAFGSTNIQVSEFAKIAVIILVSRYLHEQSHNIKLLKDGFLIPLGIAGIVSFLVLLEPDYGTAILIGAVVFTLLFLAGSRLLYSAVALISGTIGISILIYFTPTRMRRITAFLDVEGNRLGSAYQLWQSMLGLASGGLSGRGLGSGRQQLTYLPEAHTDFIFSILSEEMGGVASAGLLACYFVFFATAVSSARKLNNKFSKFLAYGISFTIIYQVIINVGVVTGLLPTKGMVLPFISYGGSSIVLLMFMIGLLLNALSSEIPIISKHDDADNSKYHDRHLEELIER